MKILITGGFGFIGSNLFQKLLSGNHEITIIDDLSTGKETKNKDIIFYNLASYDPKCEKIFEETGFDIVIHLAFKGYSKKNYMISNKDLYLNNLGLNNILYLSQKYNVQKVIILSSFKVYGHRKSEPYSEIDNTEPNSPEGNSYLSREILAKEYKKLGLNIVILRVGAVYGPGQYGTDLSFISVDEENKGDFIYIEDLCDVIVKVIFNHTEPILNVSNGEGDSNIMDNTKVKFSLDWYPKYNIEDGFNETWFWLNDDNKDGEVVVEKKDNIFHRIKSIKHRFENKDIEVTILFIITFLFSYYIKFKMGIEIDIFILYIVLISLIYGLKQGIIAASLSIISFAWFSFSYYEKSVLKLITDLNSILYLTLYFFLGVSIGYLVDEQKKNKLYLNEEVNFVKEEISFIKELYNKSQEVNRNLQNTIENYENNLTKTNNIVKKLNELSKGNVYDEITDIYLNTFYSKSVSLYTLNKERTSLSLVSVKGGKKYGESINIYEYDFLPSVIENENIFVNRDLNKEFPAICTSIYLGESIVGVIFLDDIEFNKINQYYLNNLKVTTSLIGNLSYRGYPYEKMTSEYKEIISEHEKIASEHKKISAKYEEIISKYEEMGVRYEKLSTDYQKATEDNKNYINQLKNAEKWIRKILGVK